MMLLLADVAGSDLGGAFAEQILIGLLALIAILTFGFWLAWWLDRRGRRKR